MPAPEPKRRALRPLLAGGALVLIGLLWAGRAFLARDPATDPPTAPAAHAQGYVGSASCRECHPHWHGLWTGSHHDHAMRRATAATVGGDFAASPLTFAGETTSFRRAEDRVFLTMEGPDGAPREFPVAYTFGVWPLEQFLVSGERGRMQAPLAAWDSRDESAGGRRWMRLRPEDGRIPPDDPYHSLGPYQRWNSMCAECHSTGVRKNFDDSRDQYATTWVEDGVGCEACHGAGATHVAYERGARANPGREPPPRFGLAVTLKEKRPVAWNLDPARGIWMRTPAGRPAPHYDVCARCHSRRGTIAEEDPGAPLSDTHRVALLDEGLYFADGQIEGEVFEHGSYLQSRMFAIGVGCFDCHDHRSRARIGGAAESCANCHLRERFATKAHHFHAEGGPGSRCVDCHMPTRTYMVVHERRDHSIRIPRPDLTLSIGTPNACTGCHAGKGASWAADRAKEWWPAVATRPHYGTAIDAGRRGSPGAGAALGSLIADAKVPAIVRGTAAMLLSRNPSEAAERSLDAAARDAEPLVRRGAVEGSVALSPIDRWRVVGRLLADPCRVVRIDVARRLAGTPPPTADDGARLAAALAEAHAADAWGADTPEGAMSIGDLALAEQDLDRAEQAFRTVVDRMPAFVPGYVNLADVLRVRRRETEVLAVLEKGLARLPEAAPIHHAIALAWVRAKRYPEAAKHLERAFALAPDDPGIALALGLYLSDTGDGARALTVLGAALDRHPNDVGILTVTASLLAANGDRDRAIVLLRRMEALRPSERDIRTERERLERERAR